MIGRCWPLWHGVTDITNRTELTRSEFQVHIILFLLQDDKLRWNCGFRKICYCGWLQNLSVKIDEKKTSMCYYHVMVRAVTPEQKRLLWTRCYDQIYVRKINYGLIPIFMTYMTSYNLTWPRRIEFIGGASLFYLICIEMQQKAEVYRLFSIGEHYRYRSWIDSHVFSTMFEIVTTTKLK